MCVSAVTSGRISETPNHRGRSRTRSACCRNSSAAASQRPAARAANAGTVRQLHTRYAFKRAQLFAGFFYNATGYMARTVAAQAQHNVTRRAVSPAKFYMGGI
jgi:hypothetical protein